jgi:hypothetical protein
MSEQVAKVAVEQLLNNKRPNAMLMCTFSGTLAANVTEYSAC